jgi:hypothetical protein
MNELRAGSLVAVFTDPASRNLPKHLNFDGKNYRCWTSNFCRHCGLLGHPPHLCLATAEALLKSRQDQQRKSVSDAAAAKLAAKPTPDSQAHQMDIDGDVSPNEGNTLPLAIKGKQNHCKHF